ncbi:hypothetical protein SAMN05216257_104233 [Meinhardsimonia xiamenensis]|uniref:4Fe-4S ferredoxin-type domain-containing protein n=1 Tax=Meinhardsimonia xiamenensis TaxID=990712 RepID=A0A1G9EBF1_9RHOB|nr:ferredoxin [Meinhardsimonia xiamenensis]PRX33845.1 hypothetical protein LV81_02281 [Meinhardsimonia xiamenensis]SDK73489.1 hypothetical protein SAMN05216257_104233 [Meinhardsimonia xiamenensis]
MANAFANIEAAAAAHGLAVLGGFHPTAGDALPATAATLLLVGPGPAGAMWKRFTDSPESRDGLPDPLDRWSKRVIGAIARSFGARAIFPSDGPPYPPFLAWARRSGRAWPSPTGMLVHDRAGLMVSYRGALIFSRRIALPETASTRPCDSCATRPCLCACPVGAIGPDGYDVRACRTWLRGEEGQSCMRRGCAVRCACPLSRDHLQKEAQASFHMKAFLT